MGAMIQRIGHINIRTPLLEETLAFYETVLELRRGTAKTMADQTRNAWLYDGEGRALIHVNMPAADAFVPAAGTRSRIDHVAFDGRDLAAMEKRLDRLGIEYVRRETRVRGLTQIVLRDPNGIILELAFGTDLALDRESASAA